MRIILTIFVAILALGALACRGPEAGTASPAQATIKQYQATTSVETAAAAPPALPDLDAAVTLARIQSQFVWPAGGVMSTYFGAGHPNGIDIALSYGEDSPIRASADGTVVYAGSDCCVYGKHVIIEHQGQMRTLYAHLDRLDVEEGQTVKQGQVLGLGGATGDATGKHLHFGLFDHDVPVDPLRYLPNAVVRTSAPCDAPVSLGPDSTVSLTINAPYFFADADEVVDDQEGTAGKLTRISGQEYRLEVPPVAKADGGEKHISIELLASNGPDFRRVRCDLLVSTPRTFPNPIAPRPLHSAAPPGPLLPMPAPTATPQLRLIPPTPGPTRVPLTSSTPAKPKATPAPPLTFPLKP